MIEKSRKQSIDTKSYCLVEVIVREDFLVVCPALAVIA